MLVWHRRHGEGEHCAAIGIPEALWVIYSSYPDDIATHLLNTIFVRPSIRGAVAAAVSRDLHLG